MLRTEWGRIRVEDREWKIENSNMKEEK